MNRVVLITAVVAGVTGGGLRAEGVNLQKLTQETQRIDQGEQAFRLVWWIPTEFWRESFKNISTMTQDQKNEFYRAVDGYIVLCVVDAKITMFGGFVPTPRDEVASSLSVTIGQGKKIKPLSDSEISSDARNLFAMMKPAIANTLGQVGKGMEFVCFKGTDSRGRKLLDPRARTWFSVSLAGATYKWRLPLGSLLPPKYDPDTGEEFPGNYVYSPFTGKKLVVQSSRPE